MAAEVAGTPRPAADSQAVSRHALAHLRFPDPRTTWAVVLAATLEHPIVDLQGRIESLHVALPSIGARLREERWHPGSPPTPTILAGEPVGHPALTRRFALGEEAPLRIAVGQEGARLALIGHHAAFDGLALAGIMAALLGAPPPLPVDSPPPGPAVSPWPTLRRFLRPADRVAPSPSQPPVESFAVRAVHLDGKALTARLAAACVEAIGMRNRALGSPWRRVGISVAVGGPSGAGSVATYRRLDLPAGAPVVRAVSEALETTREPTEQVSSPRALRLLQPVVDRFSDTVLVSNLGRRDIPGVSSVDFYPVARGRSAVAFGAAGLSDRPSTISLRTRDLCQEDAEALLDCTLGCLSVTPSPDWD